MRRSVFSGRVGVGIWLLLFASLLGVTTGVGCGASSGSVGSAVTSVAQETRVGAVAATSIAVSPTQSAAVPVTAVARPPSGWRVGHPDAKVVLTEFSDFQ